MRRCIFRPQSSSMILRSWLGPSHGLPANIVQTSEISLRRVLFSNSLQRLPSPLSFLFAL